MVLSANGGVIASSNCSEVPLQTSFSLHKEPRITDYRGKKFITNTMKTNGYQSFFGLDWLGQVITPVDAAFGGIASSAMEDVTEEDMAQARMFSAELKQIRKVSIEINNDLSLVVLNGKITAARKKAAEFMPVLEEIKKIGENTANIFSDSINNLRATVISSRLSDVRSMAALAVDIMDRNLYERANDCRWWALTSAFRKILAQPSITTEDGKRLSEILLYINDLYTVYTNLYLYDNQGKILAVSNDEENGLVGTHLNELSGSSAALKLNDSQHYAVSPFIKTSLYGDRHTYIYNASITCLKESGKIVGGIGIVFDSAPQFESMLSDILPSDENEKVADGCFSLFCDRSGKVISSANNTNLQPGDQLELDERFFAVENGKQLSEVIHYQNSDYVIGVAASQGYREYKTTGDYENDILGFVFMPF